MNMDTEIHKKIAECQYCGKEIERGSQYWKKFCGTKCRNAFNTQARRIGQKYLKEQLKKEREEQENDK